MALAHVAWAMDVGGLDGFGRVILATIAEACDHHGSAVLPIDVLVRRTGLSRSTLMGRLAGMERAGLLSRQARFSADGGRAPSLVTLHRTAETPRPAGGRGATSSGAGAAEPHISPPVRVADGGPRPAGGRPPVQLADGGSASSGSEPGEPQALGDRARPRARNLEHPTGSYTNTPLNPPYEPDDAAQETAEGAERGPAASPGRNAHPDDPAAGFEAFWAAYPTRPGDLPAKAERAWAKLSDERRRAALAGAKAYAARRPERPARPERWLRDRMWEAAGAGAAAAPRVFVRLGTPAAEAWWAHWADGQAAKGFRRPDRREGFPAYAGITRNAEGADGFFRPTLFPPEGPASGGAAAQPRGPPGASPSEDDLAKFARTG
jgi:hypothetical protein